MEVHDPENIEIDQYDINASLIPAEGAVVLNSSCLNVEVEEIQGGDEPGDEASGNLLSSTEQDSSPDNLDASDQTSVQEPTDLERRLSLSAQVDIATSRIQEAMNGAIDAMIEKLRSIRTDSSKDDIEAESSASLSIHTLPGVSVEPINYDVPQIFLTWPQDLRNPEVIQGEARLWQEALAKADLDQIPEMWTSTIWKPETKKSLIAQMALALKPTISQNEDSDALFDANSAIIVPCIGQMIQSDIDELRERSMYRDYAKFDQYPEILAKISIEALKLIRPTMTLGTLLQRCEEKKEDFKPHSCVDAGTWSLDYWLSIFERIIHIPHSRGFGDHFLFLSVTFAEIERISFECLTLCGQFRPETELPERMTVFSTRNFDIHSLVTVSGLTPVWTLHVNNHLRLDYSNVDEVKLMLYWFDPFLPICPSCMVSPELRQEIRKTMVLFFGSRGSLVSSQTQAIRRTYCKMPIPSVAHIDAEWPRKEASPTSKEYRPWNVKPGIGWRQLNWWYWQVRKQLFRERGSTSTDKFLRTFPREDRESFGLFGPKVPKEPRFYGSILHEIDYSEFPCYRDRIQTLRLYMDNAKPRGLKGLLKDKRDTVGYYTFWGTLGVGVTAIFLSVASFAVSVYQAWAASKSIPQSNA